MLDNVIPQTGKINHLAINSIIIKKWSEQMYPLTREYMEIKFEPTGPIAVDKRNARGLGVNDTASEILSLCNGINTFEEICGIMARNHDDTVENVRPKIELFLNDASKSQHVALLESPTDLPFKVPLSGTREYFTPNDVSFELTYSCNLRCRQCYAEAGDEHNLSKDFSTEQILGILEKLYKAKVFKVALTGGEALLRPDIMKIIKFSCERFYTQLFTNGCLITETIAEELSKLPIMVQVSLDGCDRKTHDSIRGVEGAFDMALQGIGHLTKKGVPTVIAMTVIPSTIDQIEGTYLLAKSLGANLFRVGRITPAGRAKDLGWELNESEWAELKKMQAKLSKLSADSKTAIEGGEGAITGRDDADIAEKIKEKSKLKNCGAGSLYLGITPTGDVIPCLGMYDFKMGNILKEDIETISRRHPSMHSLHSPSSQPCGECKFIYGCKECMAYGYAMSKKADCRWIKNEFAKCIGGDRN
jgi:MoaA/NifB/PqqE/SkfB family radical SAM enzyme